MSPPMSLDLTLGIDLSSQSDHTGACALSWSPQGAHIVTLELGLNDAELIELAGPANKVGIDVPLGWPIRFAEAVWSHSQELGWPTDYEHAVHRDEMRFRATDRWIAEHHGHSALSVAADRLALPAMRAAWLLPRLQVSPVDLSGAGKVVEVYPALALRRWRLPYREYKRAKGSSARTTLVTALLDRAPWLTMDDCRRDLEGSDDLVDSLVAALVARAHQSGNCEEIPEEHLDDARREGWIAVPRLSSLDALQERRAGR
jgi:predicted nuclease with RNAse H fold